jgi:DNA polymerase
LIVSDPLQELEARCLTCRTCGLRSGCRQVVFGEGDPEAAVMFIGEAPGAEEDRQGRPFVGPAGRLLDRLLAFAGFARGEVYITNIVKCRPPGNRLPTPQEAAACRPYLLEQIKLIRPKIIVCLGALATQALVDPEARITRVRGQWFEKEGMKILPTFHPAAVLRDREKLRPVAEDFRKLAAARRALEEVRPREREPARAEQLYLDFSGGGRGLA